MCLNQDVCAAAKFYLHQCHQKGVHLSPPQECGMYQNPISDQFFTSYKTDSPYNMQISKVTISAHSSQFSVLLPMMRVSWLARPSGYLHSLMTSSLFRLLTPSSSWRRNHATRKQQNTLDLWSMTSNKNSPKLVNTLLTFH